MTTTPQVLIESKLAEIAETVQYTSSNSKTAIDKFTAVNTSGSNTTITVHLIPSGGSAGVSNAFSKTLTATGTSGATWTFPEVVGHNMESGDTISTSSSANTVSIRASGRIFT